MNEYIVIIKLITGDDIIAVIVDETDNVVEVEQPFYIKYDHSVRGALLTPYCLYSDDHNFIFKNESILTISKSSPDVCDYYLNLTEQYSKLMEEKYSVEYLEELLDKIGIDNIEEDIESIRVKGNETKH
jgi:hypothetical protein